MRDGAREKVQTPRRTIEALRRYLAPLEREVFAVLWLDARHHVIEFDVISTGTVDSAQVPVREVAKKALERNAVACVLVHNHPSGSCEPSPADEFITRTLKDALSLFEIRVLDHFVVGRDTAYSFAEHGLL
ncbi:DNA repair protein RadC [mine drainage metagenome]|uniref:DNA repair protein RadC n=1 Tax=mine drainage metagenome TaxID=410659 RepID=T0ZR79_9ZZZZ